MRREDTQKVRAWLVSKYVNIGSDEIDALLAELESRGMAAEPKVIDRILRRRFPESFSREEKSMSTTGRAVPPREKPQAPAPPPSPQTAQELETIMKQYVDTNHWQTLCPNSAQPWTFRDGVMYVGSRTNLALLKAKLKEMGVQRIRVTDIQEAVNALALAGVFERIPQVQAPPPPPPPKPKPTAYELDRLMNQRDSHPVKGAKEAAKPLLKPVDNTNVAERARSAEAARENSIINEALSHINGYSGYSHSRTFSGRAALREVFQTAMDAGKPAEEVLDAVATKINQLAGDSSVR